MAVPTATDCVDYLANVAGITVAEAAVSNSLATALALLPEMTGYAPFLAANVDSVRVFDPPGLVAGRTAYGGGYGRILSLNGGLVEAPTEISVSGRVVDPATYDVKPDNAIAEGRPITTIAFKSAVNTGQSEISVTGRFGYCDEDNFPAPIFEAVIMLACSKYLAMKSSFLGVSATSWSEGDVSESYNPKALSDVAALLEKNATDTILKYARVNAGL